MGGSGRWLPNLFPAQGSQKGSPKPLRPSRAVRRKYEVLHLIGTGGSSHVWLCEERATGQKVACKVINTEWAKHPSVKQSVEREAEVLTRLAALGHPGIVQVREVYRGRKYLGLNKAGGSRIEIVMDFCEGGDLWELISRRKGLSEAEAKGLFTQVAGAVHFCHAHGILHRDIKAENVLLTRHPQCPAGSLQTRLADFGLAACVESGGTAADPGVGTRFWASPEVVRGRAGRDDGKADVWSLGLLLFCMLTGKLPKEPQTGEQRGGSIWARLQRGEVDLRLLQWSDVSCAAQDLVQRMLEPDPQKRPSLTLVLSHPWLRDSVTSSRKVPHGTLPLPLYKDGSFAHGVTPFRFPQLHVGVPDNDVFVPTPCPSSQESSPATSPTLSSKIEIDSPDSCACLSGFRPSERSENPRDTAAPNSTYRKYLGTQTDECSHPQAAANKQ